MLFIRIRVRPAVILFIILIFLFRFVFFITFASKPRSHPASYNDYSRFLQTFFIDDEATIITCSGGWDGVQKRKYRREPNNRYLVGTESTDGTGMSTAEPEFSVR